jgi:hypothetical protein
MFFIETSPPRPGCINSAQLGLRTNILQAQCLLQADPNLPTARCLASARRALAASSI